VPGTGRDEVGCREGEGGPGAGVAVFEAEGDLVIVDVEDAVVGDGDAEDVGGEVREHFMAGTGGPAVNDPFGTARPDSGVDEMEEAACGEFGLETELDASGECFVREKPVAVTVRDPAVVARGEGASGDNEVDVEMEGQVTAPGLEDADHAGEAAEVFRVASEEEKGVSGGAEEGGVDVFLMGASEGTAFVGEGEGDEEVVGGEEEGALLIEPPGGTVIAALGAGTVATGVIAVEEGVEAGGAGVEAAAEGGGTTGLDIAHGSTLGGGEGMSGRRAVGGAVAAEDLSQLGHGGSGLETGHELIDYVGGVLSSRGSKVGVDGGGGRRGVAEAFLDMAERDAGVEEVGGVGMAEGMDGGVLTDAGVLEGEAEGSLDAGDGEGMIGGGHGGGAVAGGGEEPEGVAMGLPEDAQHVQGGGRERDIAILAPFAVADVDEGASAVDVGDAELGGFTDAQAARINGGEAGAIPEWIDEGEEMLDFREGEDNGEGLRTGRSDEVKDGPLVAECLFVEELDARDEDGHGAAGSMLVVDHGEEEGANLIFGEGVGSEAVVCGELQDSPEIRLLGARRESCQAEVIDHALFARGGHGDTPF
jgi:hypothetical protein